MPAERGIFAETLLNKDDSIVLGLGCFSPDLPAILTPFMGKKSRVYEGQ